MILATCNPAGPHGPRRGVVRYAAVAALLLLAGACSGAEAAREDDRPPAEPTTTVSFPEREPIERFVSPDGRPDGAGTRSDPWDLETALAAVGPVGPGDTVWLGGGVYRGAFTSRLVGSPDEPVIVRPRPGERVVLEGPSGREATLTVRGSDTWYWGFEVRSVDPVRVVDEAGPAPTSLRRGTGVNVFAPRTRLVNLVVHDADNAVGIWSEAPDSEVYGSILFNNGFDGTDRGWGHGIYAQNREGSKRLVDNVTFNNFGFGLHVYGSGAAFLDGFHLEGNISFGNGVASARTSYQRDLLLGGGAVASSPTVIRNYTFTPPSAGAGEVNIGYDAGCSGDVVIEDNIFVEDRALELERCEATGFARNVLVGGVEGVPKDDRNTFLGEMPEAPIVVVRPNSYEPGRAHVVVYNGGRHRSVAVDLGGVRLDPGQEFAIFDIQALDREPLVTGTFDGRPVTLPVVAGPVRQPIGGPVRIAHTGPEFGAYLVVPRGDPRFP